MSYILFYTQIYNIHIMHRAHSFHTTLGYWPPDSVIFHILRRLVSLELWNLLAPILWMLFPRYPTLLSDFYLWCSSLMKYHSINETFPDHHIKCFQHTLTWMPLIRYTFSLFSLSPELQFMGLQESHGPDWAPESPQAVPSPV